MPAKPSSSDLFPIVGSPFPATLWSVVLKAKSPVSDESQRALASLCNTYWQPVYSFLRKRGKSRHDAEDLTQAFFLHLLERRAIERLRRQGKFRSFLLAALQNFVVDEWEKGRAQKRGGGAPIVSLDIENAEQIFHVDTRATADAEKIFDRRWAMTLLDRVLTRLETEWGSAGRRERFDALKMYVSGEPDLPGYAELAEQLGMSIGAVKVAVLRLRQRYRELLREELANTVSTEDEIESERRYLLQILSES
jgi:RNA polymerase sigma factor (sigma-70 family)